MLTHIRACLWLLFLTLIICSGVYPFTLWAIGRIPVFRDQAEGSLITMNNGTIVGSRLIAQPFTADEYFLPRPSAASYNAMASSGSNWAANNYLLRDRVARAIGTIARYGKGAEKFGKKPGAGVQTDIEAWFARDLYQGKPGLVAQWTSIHPGLAEAWFKNIGDKDKGQWKPADIHAVFFEMWRQDNPAVPLEPIPADMVMASGSGLDPHITLDNARYQLSHRPIVAAYAAKMGANLEEKIRAEIAKLLDATAAAPLRGLVGVPLVNVLELNIAVQERMRALGEP